jgi:hypothetical protein
MQNFKSLREVGPCSYHCILNCYNVNFLCCSGPGIIQRNLPPSIRQCCSTRDSTVQYITSVPAATLDGCYDQTSDR